MAKKTRNTRTRHAKWTMSVAATEVNESDAGRFMNHSSSPNFGMDGAVKDIAEGEEA